MAFLLPSHVAAQVATCFQLTGSTTCPAFSNDYIMPMAGAFQDVASFDQYVMSRYDNNTIYIQSFQNSYGCPNYNGNGQRYHISTYCALLVSQAATAGCQAPKAQICQSTCQMSMATLQKLFADPMSCTAAISAPQQASRATTLSYYQALCTTGSSTAAGCVAAEKIDSATCGFFSQAEFTAYCAANATDGCCKGGAPGMGTPAGGATATGGTIPRAVATPTGGVGTPTTGTQTTAAPGAVGAPSTTAAAVAAAAATKILGMSYFTLFAIFAVLSVVTITTCFCLWWGRKKNVDFVSGFMALVNPWGGRGDHDSAKDKVDVEGGYGSRKHESYNPDDMEYTPATLAAMGGDTGDNNSGKSKGFGAFRESVAATKGMFNKFLGGGKKKEAPATHRAIANYIPTLEDEMQITVDDDVEILESFDDGWALGRNTTSRKEGVFPLACLGLDESLHPVHPSFSVASEAGWNSGSSKPTGNPIHFSAYRRRSSLYTTGVESHHNGPLGSSREPSMYQDYQFPKNGTASSRRYTESSHQSVY
ncbi:hypothetical protein SeLEV6574_g02773 [Synchytrium endobioticum]|nr:hypothetical protein SeLEV6574_g02773 [Synchytrium endobioticum]